MKPRKDDLNFLGAA